ncbi:MAG TPA: hypothetical protein VMC83_04005 [Streptosporangiaceae bacterium]|nr:hypothetical protein [Streptosporangiaceae bacterium]
MQAVLRPALAISRPQAPGHKPFGSHTARFGYRPVPRKVVAYDAATGELLLYADGEDLTMLPHPQRRAALEAALTLSPRLRLTTAADVTDPAALDAMFAQAVTDGCESLVCKSVGPS